ncbi:alpha-amylase family glycosyl hydrolase [Bacteroidota bacterium]
MKLFFALFVGLIFSQILFAQSNESVDVTFYYFPNGNPSKVYIPGEFNEWTLSSSTLMNEDPATGIWSKTVRLRVGGPNPLPAQYSVPGAYQYKFNADGTWLQDPLNPRQNPNDNNNSYLYIKNPTIHYLLPNSTNASGVVRTRFPEITAYIFPSISSEVDTSTITVSIDGVEYANIGSSYDSLLKKLSFIPSDPLGNGVHELILSVQSINGTFSADSTSFTIQAGAVQFLTLPSETWKNSWRLQGAIFDSSGGFDTTVTTAEIIRSDSSWAVKVIDGTVDTSLYLLEGDNFFTIRTEVNENIEISDPINILRKVNHSPYAQIEIAQDGNNLILSGANSTDPDEQQLTYIWTENPNNPEILGISGITDEVANVSKPTAQGEYYISLSVEDTDFNSDSTTTYFIVEQDSPDVKIAGYEDNPEWVKNGRIYLMYFKAFTPTGTIQSAIPNLDYIKAMGFNIIWVLPVTEISNTCDNQTNIGYDIVDFLKVENSLGTEEDYKEFIEEAHKRGIKVIQDITPNHTSRDHTFAKEVSISKNFSQYWNYYQTQFISHNNNGLGDCVTPEGIWYYCAFSNRLLNYDWRDLDARNYMIEVYKYWVKEFDIDGYRFDVYWAPHRKYGEAYMGIPVRKALKHIKPDIMLLGEDDGVGAGTEVLYADKGGGLDVSYDFKLYFDAIRGFNFTAGSVNTLHSKLDNNGYHPGENSYFLRFMETQDEDRISYKYNSFEKTMPIATSVFMAPGIPLMLNGQEVGFGKGMGAPGEPDLNDRRRGIINWDFGGRDLLTPHYQKLAQIRAQFPAFSQHRKDTNGDGNINNQDKSDFIRVNTGNNIVYPFLRPYKDSNGLTVVNFSGNSQSVTLDLTATGLDFTEEFNTSSSYWINDLYNSTSSEVQGSELDNFFVSLSPYGSAIYTISTQEEMVDIPPLPAIVSVDNEQVSPPDEFTLFQNYPNPFNPSTVISYQLPKTSKVTIKVFDILGRDVVTLVNKEQTAGRYQVKFRNNELKLSSGIYFYRIVASTFMETRKMMLVK